MPIIGNVGRRSLKVRILNITIHLVLLVGATTMVYPFLMMLSGSVKSAVDSKKLTAIPEYFYSEDMLYRKWVETKYNEDVSAYIIACRERPYTFMEVNLPRNPVLKRCEDWNEFLDETDDPVVKLCSVLGHSYGVGVKPEMFRQFIMDLKADPGVDGDIVKLNEKYESTFTKWERIGHPALEFITRETSGDMTPFMRRTVEFRDSRPRDNLDYYSLGAFWIEILLKPKYGTVEGLNEALGTSFPSWRSIKLARTLPEGPLKEDWIYFVQQRLNLRLIEVSEEALPDYQNFLEKQYEDIAALNSPDRYNTSYESFKDIPLLHDLPLGGIVLADWGVFIADVVKPEHLVVKSAEFAYRDFLKKKYGGDLNALIVAHRLGLQGLDELVLPEKLPADNVVYSADWTEFARANIDSGWVAPDSGARRDWVNFLTEPYAYTEKDEEGNDLEKVDMDALNAALGTNYLDELKIAIPLTLPVQPALAEKWREFMLTVCSPQLLRVDVANATEAWNAFISNKYSDVEAVNKSYGLKPTSFDEVVMPMTDVDWFTFAANKRHVFWEFFKRNYAIVFQMMAYNGRAIINTVIYCSLAIIVALIVNPLAAYAMSRYKPPSQYKLLLMLMLTMAFPPMVLSIPNFLLLRDLHLLNTYAALVLPGMANGYMIFILKGFFDSLPRELYESAQIDGASEWTMFWNITMATSKPILAVIALGAFTGAYGNFMLAFIVCQDSKMWTMMVHIYQLQGSSSQAVTFAALVIAAIPTLLVFVFCQNIIIRGIVVPTEK